jgi:hypothetical protein
MFRLTIIADESQWIKKGRRYVRPGERILRGIEALHSDQETWDSEGVLASLPPRDATRTEGSPPHHEFTLRGGAGPRIAGCDDRPAVDAGRSGYSTPGGRITPGCDSDGVRLITCRRSSRR